MTVLKALPAELIDSLMAGYEKPEDLIGEDGLLKQLTKAIVERALQAEMVEHLGHGKHEPVVNASGNARNGRSEKTLKGDFGAMTIELPRDRQSSFEPKIITKHQTHWRGFDDKILSLYARGMTTREIQGHLEDDVWHRSITGADFIGHRCGDRRSHGMAKPAFRCVVSDRLP